ncbi:hypothetical protein DMN91_000695 [Ooceraea biroi]|uniref:Transport and Golgi organization protein n=1 Tax=Ooceraea biroi TaxID=2015173 RepID=A0A3L8E2I2_OOCBI|nr:hypothetical protein DMN91_000695 [Ooceraea biroi]
MCILFVYRNPNADAGSYRLIVASNRDEAYRRPASAAHYWEKHPECLGGIDMEPGKEGGTWLALSMKGKAAVILNLVMPEDAYQIPNYREDLQTSTRNLVRFLLLEQNMVQERILCYWSMVQIK